MFRNLVLVGFMGSGKSSVGRILSSLTGFSLVDTDQLVARDAGCNISEIFSRHGEPHFRTLETNVLRSLVGRIGLIVSTGGGAILAEENREAMRGIGPVVWLDANMEQLHQRTRHGRRPLLQTEDPRATLEQLYTMREELYRQAADVRIDSSHLSHKQTAEAVLAAVQQIDR